MFIVYFVSFRIDVEFCFIECVVLEMFYVFLVLNNFNIIYWIVYFLFMIMFFSFIVDYYVLYEK